MDWSLCLICQEKTTEPLKCPLNVRRSGDKSGAYSHFLNNVNAFRGLGELPVVLNFGEEMTTDELVQNRGAWHKSCNVKFSKDKLERATKKRDREETTRSETYGEKRPRRQSMDKMACIFCRGKDGHLHEFKTLGADENIRQMATQLQETKLLATLEGGDLIALEAKYHLECLTALRNRHRSLVRQQGQESGGLSEEKRMKARAIVELFTHVENCVEDGTFYFKFSDLYQLYEQRLQNLGVEKEINRTHFKEKVLAYFPQAQEQSDGKNKILVFEQGMQDMLKQAMACDYEGDALLLAKTAKLVRKEIVSNKGFHFDGKFPSGCQEESVPSTLKTLVSMILNGADLKDQDSTDSQANLTVSQTILFNFKKRAPSSLAKFWHSLDREPPLALYIGMKIHTDTRSKKLITQLHDLGLSVSYDRVLQLENQLGTAVCEDFKAKGAVVPAQLRHGLFTVGALDNLDHNPSSTTAKGSFHGTGISLFQFSTSCNLGERQNDIKLPLADTKKNHQLPDSFTTIPAVVLKTANVSVPELSNPTAPKEGQLVEAQLKEKSWLEHACRLLEKDAVEKGDTVAWSAFHASMQDVSADVHTTLTQLLPLFYEKAATAAMIKHGMNVLHWATKFLNPGQIPVIAFDAPLYALAKYTQWNWPDTHNEENIIAMLGGLHIEMAMWKTYGDYLEGSGWTNALTQAAIASSGTADSILKATHLTRTRHAHQVTALALAKLQEDAFMHTEGAHSDEAKDAWRQEMIQKSPTFQYWDTVLNMELLGLIFVRSHREGNFSLYVESLKALAPWFFALDHHNYARWLPIHIRDMENLPAAILKEFEEHSHWVIHKTTNRFSAIPIDQAHEQNNKVVKDSGGAVGLTENPSAFRKWMVSGPEQARLLKEFEKVYFPEKDSECGYHHEEGLSTQISFKEQAVSLTQVIKELGNPFLDDSDELLALDTQNILDESVVNTVRTIHTLGKDQYDKCRKEVITDRTCSIHEPIKKNALPLVRCPQPRAKTKQAGKISLLKNDVALFSHLYIVMQHRMSDMSKFFSHENHPFPPSLSDSGKLRFGKKSDLLNILAIDDQNDPPNSFDVRLLDGAAVVHFLPTNNIVTFDEYADQVFVPHIIKQLENSKRVDVVWDEYIPSSIKESTREKRGKGIRRKVAGKNKLPGNWADFLRDPTNKQELFAFLSNKLITVDCPKNKEIIITSGAATLLRGTDRSMAQCDHEEADTRLLIHLQDAILNGCTNCLVRTVDTDVVVILIGKFHHLITLCRDVNIWVAFGTGRHFTYHHINAICEVLGREKSLALPVFHSFTGCDTTSAFFGRGKKSAWEAWLRYQNVTDAFTHIALNPYTEVAVGAQHFQLLERFTVILYDKASDLEHVNEARKELFCQKGKTMEALPPTQDALLQHCKRVAYQSGIWCTSEHSEQHAPSPEGWGWTLGEDSQSWIPVWATLPVACEACSELVKCGCKSPKGCAARCACRKANWKCTELCSCHCQK